ncbi:cadmium resistance protein CadD, partial [Leuconostoc mesenteroides]|nr:cadmium resistance protein CadD [Leuconostoc mesenteroides]
MNLILTILSALGSFIVTNIDDIFVLMLLFSQASSQAKASNGRT